MELGPPFILQVPRSRGNFHSTAVTYLHPPLMSSYRKRRPVKNGKLIAERVWTRDVTTNDWVNIHQPPPKKTNQNRPVYAPPNATSRVFQIFAKPPPSVASSAAGPSLTPDMDVFHATDLYQRVPQQRQYDATRDSLDTVPTETQDDDDNLPDITDLRLNEVCVISLFRSLQL